MYSIITLLARGHQITVVNPFDMKTKAKNIQWIRQKNNPVEILDFSSQMLKNDNTAFDSLKATVGVIGKLFYLWTDIFQELKEDHQFFGKNQFDLVICYGMLSSEVSYYMAHKFNATLALYSALQSSYVNLDWSMGQPHNPAYLPLMGTDLKVMTGWKKITLVILKSKYFLGLFDFLQKTFAIRTVKGLQITCI